MDELTAQLGTIDHNYEMGLITEEERIAQRIDTKVVYYGGSIPVSEFERVFSSEELNYINA